jgi:Tfp pilus assembly protein PilX
VTGPDDLFGGFAPPLGRLSHVWMRQLRMLRRALSSCAAPPRLARAAARNERGLALPMAIGIMAVLGVAGASLMLYTTSNQRHAHHSRAEQQAYALAEAGLNDAFSVLASGYPATYPGNSSLLPTTTRSYDNGSVTYSGTLSTLSATWTVTSTSTVRNPSAGGSVHQTLTAVVPVNLSGTTSTVPPAWNWIYSGATGNTCDVTLQQSVQLASPLYVAGNLCLQNTAAVVQPSGGSGNRLVVGGKLTLSQSANAVGTSGTPLTEAHVIGGCQYKNNTFYNPCQPNLAASNVWVQSGGFYTTAPNPAIPAPTVDWWGNYQRAAPGPFRPCYSSSGTVPTFEVASETGSAVQSNMNADVPSVFNLTPASSYSCTSGLGTLAWNASTKVLTVSGTIFLDGSVSMDMSWASGAVATYRGQAVLYAYGTLLVKNTSLCVVVQGSGCDQSSGAWDPNQNVLIVAAHGNGSAGGSQGQVSNGDSIQVVSSNFQGGLYGTDAIDIGTTSQVQGPLVSPSTIMPGQSGSFSFPAIQLLPFSVPGSTAPLPSATLSPPVNYGGG